MGLDVKRGHAWIAAAAIALAGLPGCATSDDPGDAEPDIGSMVVTIEEIAYTATQPAGGFGGSSAKVSAGNVPLKVEFFRPGGGRETAVNASDFEIRLAANNSGAPLPSPIEFERTGAFTGTLSGLEEDQELVVYFSLFHKTETHTEFGPYFLNIHWELPGGGDPQT